MIATGLVVDDATGLPIPNANVAVYNMTTGSLVGGTTTNIDGLFETPVLSGTAVTISALGYESVSPLLRDGVAEEIRLKPAVYDVPHAIVTATKTYYKQILLAALALAVIYFAFFND